MADTNSPNTTVEMTELRIVSALLPESIHSSCSSANGGTVTGEGNYSHGEITPINAVPHWLFLYRMVGGWRADASSSNTSVEMTEPRIVSASFSPNQYALNVLSGNGGAVTGRVIFRTGNNTH